MQRSESSLNKELQSILYCVQFAVFIRQMKIVINDGGFSILIVAFVH